MYEMGFDISSYYHYMCWFGMRLQIAPAGKLPFVKTWIAGWQCSALVCALMSSCHMCAIMSDILFHTDNNRLTYCYFGLINAARRNARELTSLIVLLSYFGRSGFVQLSNFKYVQNTDKVMKIFD